MFRFLPTFCPFWLLSCTFKVIYAKFQCSVLNLAYISRFRETLRKTLMKRKQERNKSIFFYLLEIQPLLFIFFKYLKNVYSIATPYMALQNYLGVVPPKLRFFFNRKSADLSPSTISRNFSNHGFEEKKICYSAS